MGGTVPLGYDAVGRKLIVNEAEAPTLRAIFAALVELGLMKKTLCWSQQRGLTPK